MRVYKFMFDDNFNGLFGHRSGELVNRKPVESRLVHMPRAQQIQVGRRSASVRIGKAFVEKLKKLGIK